VAVANIRWVDRRWHRSRRSAILRGRPHRHQGRSHSSKEQEAGCHSGRHRRQVHTYKRTSIRTEGTNIRTRTVFTNTRRPGTNIRCSHRSHLQEVWWGGCTMAPWHRRHRRPGLHNRRHPCRLVTLPRRMRWGTCKTTITSGLEPPPLSSLWPQR
jgi:hypothetical protein